MGVAGGSRLSKYSGERSGPKVTLLRVLLRGGSLGVDISTIIVDMVFSTKALLRGEGEILSSSTSGMDINDDLRDDRLTREDSREEGILSLDFRLGDFLRGEGVTVSSFSSGMDIKEDFREAPDVRLDEVEELREGMGVGTFSEGLTLLGGVFNACKRNKRLLIFHLFSNTYNNIAYC